MSDKNTSTLQSYADSVTGAVQSAIGNLTGSAGDQVRPYILNLTYPSAPYILPNLVGPTQLTNKQTERR